MVSTEFFGTTTSGSAPIEMRITNVRMKNIPPASRLAKNIFKKSFILKYVLIDM
jgi:hypothetical protein